MGRRKRETRGTTLMVCACLIVGCMAPCGKGAAPTTSLGSACAVSSCVPYLHAAEVGCGGETQLWIDAHVPEPVVDVSAKVAPEEVVPPTEGEAPVSTDQPSERAATEAVGLPAERDASSTGEQLRRSISVPVEQGQALPLTADSLTSANRLGAIALGAALAVVLGVRARGGVRV